MPIKLFTKRPWQMLIRVILYTGRHFACTGCPKKRGILVLWLLVGYWWDEVQNRWDPSHFMLSQTPTNHPSQFFWHCHNSVPKWKVSNKIIFERIIESKSFILNRNLAFICQLFGNWQGESVKKRIFYGQADCKGGGVSHLGPDCKQMWKLWFFSLILDSLTLKTHLFSL